MASRFDKQWRGIDRGDDRKRIYRKLHRYCPGKIRRNHRRGRLISSFPKHKLLRIAWKIGVSNPDGFGREDFQYWGIDDEEEGFEFFLSGWTDETKDCIENYIWGRLYDTDEIIAV